MEDGEVLVAPRTEPMNPDRWQKLDDLFHAALQHDSRDRKGFVAQSCDGDDELKRELESLLDHHDRASGFIEAPGYTLDAESLVAGDYYALEGTTLGSYRVLSKLGP